MDVPSAWPDGGSLKANGNNDVLWMLKHGSMESTIRPCVKALKAIARRTDLPDSESVKSYVGPAEPSENRKERVADDLVRFYRHKGIQFGKRRATGV